MDPVSSPMMATDHDEVDEGGGESNSSLPSLLRGSQGSMSRGLLDLIGRRGHTCIM